MALFGRIRSPCSRCEPTLLLFLSLSLVTALSPMGTYTVGPLTLPTAGKLWHRVDLSTRMVQLALLVNDTRLAPTSSPAWLGLGISEPTSGSMLGADVVTAEFEAGITDTCNITDRYVPFFAFPLIKSAGGAPAVFPDPDDCQDDGSWVLTRCERDAKRGEIILEVNRSLDAHDTQDREIVAGLNSVIYAYGGNFGYHGPSRASTQVVFYEKGAKPGEPISAEPPLPDDVDGFMEIRATNYTVPASSGTIYACTSKVFELEGDKNRMVVAADHFFDSPLNMVHHLTLFLCSGKEYAKKIAKTTECTTDSSNDIGGPVANQEAGCSTFIYAYAKGMGRFIVPREAGFLVQKGRAFIVMETHYDNPNKIVGNIDNSGTRLYYTDTMRQNEAGTLILGDTLLSRFDDPVQTGFVYEHTCPSQCTERFTRNINVFGSFLHMHLTGQEIYTNKFSKDRKFLENTNKVNFWSDSFQKYVFFDPPLSVKPGEQLQLSCVYDTRKRPNTVFGLATKDEMCVDFLGYWPVQKNPANNEEISTCSYATRGNQTVTLCGDIGKFTNRTVIALRNPSFNDKVGAPTTFGDNIRTCPIPVPSYSAAEPSTVPTSTADPVGFENSPSPSLRPDTENTCFPAKATVALRDGSLRRMDELKIGDEVQVGPSAFSFVFLFTHKNGHVQQNFVQLQTVEGASLLLTPGHFLCVNRRLEEASNVKVGDRLTLFNGRMAYVSTVSMRTARGLFNPQTIHGDIIVDGVLTTTYTRAVDPRTAHGLLAPITFLYHLLGVDTSAFILRG